jgi:hypothetical protein
MPFQKWICILFWTPSIISVVRRLDGLSVVIYRKCQITFRNKNRLKLCGFTPTYKSLNLMDPESYAVSNGPFNLSLHQEGVLFLLPGLPNKL